jgi:hypothetical protein
MNFILSLLVVVVVFTRPLLILISCQAAFIPGRVLKGKQVDLDMIGAAVDPKLAH